MDNTIQGYTAAQINYDIKPLVGFTGLMGTYGYADMFQQIVVPDLKKNLTELQIELKTKENLNSLEVVDYITSSLKKKKRHRLCNNMRFAYTQKYNHVFIIFEDDLYSQRCIIDLMAAKFNQNEIIIKNLADFDSKTMPWWNYDKLYNTKASLIKYLRKMGWNIEKKTASKLKLITSGATNLKNNEIRVLPFDEEAKLFLEKYSKGAAANTSIAKLLLSSNKDQIKKLVPIINNM